MFLDDMGLYPSFDNRRRPSITLDAGYVSIIPINICQSSKTIGLHGKKLVCVICIILILFLISFINLTVSCFVFSFFLINKI
jgi:hypothetical protein